MGTTRTALLNDDGVRIAFVLSIEGYDHLLTSGDIDACLDAWSGTPWNNALPGLQVSGNISQSFQPFSNDLQVQSLTVRVLPEESDKFGEDVFKSKPEYKSKLKVEFPRQAGGFTMVPKKVFAGMPNAGLVYLGNKAYEYTAKSTGFIPGYAIALQGAGVFSPFATSTGAAFTFPGKGVVPKADLVGSWVRKTAMEVSSSRRSWSGAKVGLWVHRITGEGPGSWDSQAQAELIFAGTIDSVNEDDATGGTVLELKGVQAQIEDAVLLDDQWTARAKAEIGIREGDYFRFTFHEYNGAGDEQLKRNDKTFTAVVGASQRWEIEPGGYTQQEIFSRMTDWLNNDAVLGAYKWEISVTSVDGQLRSKFFCSSEGESNRSRVEIKAKDFQFMGTFGIDRSQLDREKPAVLWLNHDDDAKGYQVIGQFQLYRSFVNFYLRDGLDIPLEQPTGSFFNNREFLPESAKQNTSPGEQWGYFRVKNDFMILAQLKGPTTLTNAVFVDGLLGKTTEGIDVNEFQDEAFEIKQVAVLTGGFAKLLTSLMASIDGNGVNDTTFDIFPWGAGVPMSLLSNFHDSARDIEESAGNGSMTIVIEKPAKLWDVVKSDLMLRSAFVVWREGGLQLASMQTPSAYNADWVFDEDNKAVGPGSESRTMTQHTTEFLVNNFKIEYGRHPITDKYENEYIARNPTSIESYGLSKPIKIKARNSIKSEKGGGDSVEALADMVTARLLPPFGKPLRRWRRSISHNLFFAAPGDTVSFSDRFTREPATGKRGTSSRGGTVLSTTWNMGVSNGGQQYNGTAEILFSEDDRAFPMAPALMHAHYTSGTFIAGWSPFTRKLAVEDHGFSVATDPDDISRFSVGDTVTITMRDPDDPNTGASFQDTISGIDVGSPTTVMLTNGFGVATNPAFDPSKFYVVTLPQYSDASNEQRISAFMAEEFDDLIQELADPNEMGNDRLMDFDEHDITLLPELHNDNWFADGAPFHPHIMKCASRMVNSLVNHRCLSQSQVQVSAIRYQSPVGGVPSPGIADWGIVFCFPFYIGGGRYGGDRKRNLIVAPQFAKFLPVSATAQVRITSSQSPPIDSSNQWNDVSWSGKVHQVTFSNTTVNRVVATPQLLEPIRSTTYPDVTWINVELNRSAVLWGIPEIRLGVIT